MKIPQTRYEKQIPYAKWEMVDVEFLAADTNLVIPHTLTPRDPYAVRFEVVDRTVGGVVYRGSKAPSTDYIVLRSTDAGKVRLRLFLEAHQEEEASRL